MALARLAPGDREGVEPGLYSVCLDCLETLRPLFAERLGKDPKDLGRNDFI